MAWTQPQCERCWFDENPDRMPTRIVEHREFANLCCMCGLPTVAGIFIRRDPATVPYPREEEI